MILDIFLADVQLPTPHPCDMLYSVPMLTGCLIGAHLESNVVPNLGAHFRYGNQHVQHTVAAAAAAAGLAELARQERCSAFDTIFGPSHTPSPVLYHPTHAV